MQQIFIVLLVLFIGYLVWITIRVLKIEKHYKRLAAFTGKENLRDMLGSILDRLVIEEKAIENIKKEILAIRKENLTHVQKVGLLRYNPFSDTGGDQSFVMAILDGLDNGIVLTSLHSRGMTRWYAKNVLNGKGVDFELSHEELSAIKSAVNLRINKLNKK